MGKKTIALFVLAVLALASVPASAQTLLKIGRDLDIAEGQVVDNAIAVGGQITVGGLVEKRLIALGGSVVLTSDAVVRGDIICIGGVVVVGSGAQIFGKVTEINSDNLFGALSGAFYGDEDEWDWLAEVISLCFFLTLAALALLMVFLFPGPLNAVAAFVSENKLKSFLAGALASFLSVPLFMLLVLSIVGIALIPLAFFLMLAAFMFGFVAVSALLGRFVLTNMFVHHNLSTIRETLLGLVLWWILGWLPFYSGMIIKAVVITTGFGGVLLTVFSRRQRA